MHPHLDPTDYTLPELEEMLAHWGHLRFRARQLLKWVYKGTTDWGLMTDLAKGLRQELADRLTLTGPALELTQASHDGTRKFRWRLLDGEAIESVLIPEGDHYTLCLSSQAGCAMGCRFCLTALGGFRRNLTPGEIVRQVLAVRTQLSGDLPLTNLVFMGMGEPLANFAAVVKAIRILQAPWGLNFSRRRVTVSTVGLAPLIPRLGEEVPVNLTVSLNAVDDATRSALMPVNDRYPLKEVLAACRRFPLPPHRRITFAYVLLRGVNDSLAEARELVRLLKGFRAKVNLIPFNPHPRLPFEAPRPERVAAFQEIIHRAHLPVFIRESRGADIAAACGQLAVEPE